MALLRPLALFIIFGCWASMGFAQDTSRPADDNSGDIITGASANPETCNIGNAIPVKFESAMHDRGKFSGRCIVVEGFWAGRALFKNASDGNMQFSKSAKSSRRRRIGTYGTEHMLQIAPKKSVRYKLVGIYGQCETQWPGAMMVMGYCHYTGGPILLLSQAFKAAD